MKDFPERDTIQKQLATYKREVLTNPEWKAFYRAHSEITDQMIDRSLPKLLEYVDGRKNCEGCTSLATCQNMINGYEPELFINGKTIDIRYNRCRTRIASDEFKKVQSLIKSYSIPKEILSATFEQFEQDGRDRFNALRLAGDFIKSMENESDGFKGLYFYGDFGVGKTFLMGAIANALAKKKVQTMLVYTPDFFREMKTSIGDQTVDEKLEVIKTARVLVLDDIGAESMSSWVRDEVLGSILQYRMMEQLPTLYTSNYDYDELEEHMSYSQKGGVEQLKAKRIMERIKHYTTPVYIGGKNRRER